MATSSEKSIDMGTFGKSAFDNWNPPFSFGNSCGNLETTFSSSNDSSEIKEMESKGDKEKEEEVTVESLKKLLEYKQKNTAEREKEREKIVLQQIILSIKREEGTSIKITGLSLRNRQLLTDAGFKVSGVDHWQYSYSIISWA